MKTLYILVSNVFFIGCELKNQCRVQIKLHNWKKHIVQNFLAVIARETAFNIVVIDIVTVSVTPLQAHLPLPLTMTTSSACGILSRNYYTSYYYANKNYAGKSFFGSFDFDNMLYATI